MIEHSALYWTKAQARGLGGSDAAVSMCHRARRVPACLDEHVTAILSRLPWWVQQVAPRLLFLICEWDGLPRFHMLALLGVLARHLTLYILQHLSLSASEQHLWSAA